MRSAIAAQLGYKVKPRTFKMDIHQHQHHSCPKGLRLILSKDSPRQTASLKSPDSPRLLLVCGVAYVATSQLPGGQEREGEEKHSAKSEDRKGRSGSLKR